MNLRKIADGYLPVKTPSGKVWRTRDLSTRNAPWVRYKRIEAIAQAAKAGEIAGENFRNSARSC